MKKYMFILTFAVISLLAFTACSEDTANESNLAEQVVSVTQNNQQHNRTNEQEAQSQHTNHNQFAVEQADTLNRIRLHDDWIADMMGKWSNELDMTVDEIFDYVRAATNLDYGFDYLIEGGMDVSELAAKVGESSGGFMGIVHTAYSVTRSVDVTHKWAFELDMTVFNLVDYVFGGNNSQHLADTLGVEWGEFTNVLAGVGSALWNYRLLSHANAESVDIASKWADELDTTLDGLIDSFNAFNFDILSISETLGVEVMDFMLVMQGSIAFLNPHE